MAAPKIAIIISSTREARFGEKPAQWIKAIAKERGDMEVEIVDLRDYPLPFFEEVASNAWAPSKSEVAQRWQKKIDEFDGYIFITAEYNHSISGALKNALDYASPEWKRKAAAYLGYGGVGAARAIEHLRLIAVELQMASVKSAVHIGGADFMATVKEGRPLNELPHLKPSADAMLNDLVWWANALKAARSKSA